MPGAQTLRLAVAAEATIMWSADGWASVRKTATTPVADLNVWFADLDTEECREGAVIEFTFFWREAGRWEGRNASVAIRGRMR
jgi:glucoamylase